MKNKSSFFSDGFGLIEVLITLAIVGFMLSAFFLFAQQAVKQFFQKSNAIQVFYDEREYLLSIHQDRISQKNGEGIKKEGIKTQNSMQYQLKKVEKKSQLGAVPNLYVEKIINKEFDQSPLISLLWVPEEVHD